MCTLPNEITKSYALPKWSLNNEMTILHVWRDKRKSHVWRTRRMGELLLQRWLAIKTPLRIPLFYSTS